MATRSKLLRLEQSRRHALPSRWRRRGSKPLAQRGEMEARSLGLGSRLGSPPPRRQCLGSKPLARPASVAGAARCRARSLGPKSRPPGLNRCFLRSEWRSLGSKPHAHEVSKTAKAPDRGCTSKCGRTNRKAGLGYALRPWLRSAACAQAQTLCGTPPWQCAVTRLGATYSGAP